MMETKKGLLSRMVLTTLLISLPVLAQEVPHEVVRRDCGECHSSTTWKRIRFDHQQTRFPLTGKHRDLNCSACHHIRDFSQVSSDCNGCHVDVHQARLGSDCQSCHRPTGWSEVDILEAHANTAFPLLGAHARLDCKACHIGEIEGEFSSLKSECYACHETAYVSAGAPDHVQAQFSLRCEICHTLTSWQPANFTEHEGFFPIFSGEHAGEWSTCGDCHLSANNYQIFSCLTCHAHDQAEMDREHREVSGYSYESTACFSCHPRGRKEEGKGD